MPTDGRAELTPGQYKNHMLPGGYMMATIQGGKNSALNWAVSLNQQYLQ